MMRVLVAGAAVLLSLSGPVRTWAQETESTRHEPLMLTFVGDIMHHDRNAAMPDYDRIYDSVRSYLHRDDLSFANIEFPVDPSRVPSGYPVFNGTVAYVESAIRGGFDVFSLANNHTYDLGAEGVDATALQFSKLAAAHGISYNGLRESGSSPVTPTSIQSGSWNIGFVAITTFSNEPGSSHRVNLVNTADAEVVSAFLGQVRRWDSDYDLLIVSVHSGTEYVTAPDLSKAQFFRDLVAHGADIVWGHHPHVLQPWEVIRAVGGTRLIIHSAGNFISAQRRLQQPFLPAGRWAPTGDTAVFSVEVEHGNRGPRVSGVRTPIFTVHDDPVHGLVPRTFGEVLTSPLSLAWRTFYLARLAATRDLLDSPISGSAVRRVIIDGQP